MSIIRLLLLVLLLALALPVYAQESTEMPPVVADDITVEDGGTVNIETPPESDALPAVINLVIVVLGALAAGGGFALMWDRLRRSKEAKDTIEHLAESLSPTWKSTIDRMLDVAEQVNKTAGEVLQFAREVTDGKPNEPPEPPIG